MYIYRYIVRPKSRPKSLARVYPAARRLVKCGPWCQGSCSRCPASTICGIAEWSIAA